MPQLLNAFEKYPVLATYSIRPSFCKSQQEFRQPIDLSIHWDALSDSVWRNASLTSIQIHCDFTT
jgi:hypothetical protein